MRIIFVNLNVLMKLVVSISILSFVFFTVLKNYGNEQLLPRDYDIKINTNEKQNACFFVLTRNEDLNDLIKTVIRIENAFNYRYNYPYVIVTDTYFTKEFQNEIVKHTKALVEFGSIPQEEWSIPAWIDMNKLAKSFNTVLRYVYYGTLMSYHHMCRYYSGFFFRHNLTLKYEYYWRLDSHVQFPCPIYEDPFFTLKKNNQLYGFTISIGDDFYTGLHNLWRHVQIWAQFKRASDMTKFVADSYPSALTSNCTVWNNFEIASFSIFRSKDYLDFFDYIDKTGGFFYERWGDAAVHTYYILTRLNKSEMHRFKNIGYGHTTRYNWPVDEKIREKCLKKADDSQLPNCNRKWDDLIEEV